MPKKLRRNRKRQGRKGNASSLVKRFDTNHPERWLDWTANNCFIGKSTGVLGTGSAAWNVALLNTDDSTVPVEIAQGTANNCRVGTHTILTRLTMRFYATLTQGSRMRLMIFANPRDNQNTSSSKTNAQLTALVEASPFLIPPAKSFGGSGAIGPIDYCMDPTCDYTVLFDRMYGGGSLSTAFNCNTSNNLGSNIFPIEVDLDLMLPVMYNAVGKPQTGDLIIYMCSTSANGNASNIALSQAQLFGTMRLQYVDALNLEAIGRSIRDFIDEAGNTLEHMSKSSLMKYARMAAPYVTQAFGIGI